MAETKTSIQTYEQVAKFANGKQMVYDGIAEYNSLPKCDKREYIVRLLALYNLALQGANEREKWVNEARKEAATAHENAKTLSEELEAFKSSFWYRLYTLFA